MRNIKLLQPAELDEAVESTVRELLSGGPYALRACKALARDIGAMDNDAARAYRF